MAEVVVVRHGQTEWSVARRHTGRTDIPLTDAGRGDAERLRGRLAARTFARVLSSPLSRAVETCRLAGFGDRAELRDDLREWDYGAYEGRTTPDIRRRDPDWMMWRDGCPDGERAEDVGRRVAPLVAELRAADGDVLVFAHGHLLRVLAARWIELPPEAGAHLVLDTGALGVLGWEREWPALSLWNDDGHLAPAGGA
jgi:broad specificity phosphatase PhoE